MVVLLTDTGKVGFRQGGGEVVGIGLRTGNQASSLGHASFEMSD